MLLADVLFMQSVVIPPSDFYTSGLPTMLYCIFIQRTCSSMEYIIRIYTYIAIYISLSTIVLNSRDW